jgi:hypothetical protein
MKKFLYILFFSLLSTAAMHAQNATAEAQLDRYAIRIGEQCTLKLYVRYTEGSAKADVQWPTINDSITTHIEFSGQDTVSTTLVDRVSVMYEQKCSWVLTSFDSGLWVIPPVPFVVNNDTVWTNMIELYVNTVPVDTSQPLKAIASIYDVPPPPPLTEDNSISIWWWIGGGLILITAIILFLLSRKKKPVPVVAPTAVQHVLLPHEVVLHKLHEMAINKPWRNGNTKGHYTELTELMRGWVVERFRFPAMEMTTYQIMMRLRRMPDSGNKTSELEHVLRTADLVKFGKQVPEEYVNEKCIQDAIDFVMSTSFATVQLPPPPPPPFYPPQR